MLDPTLELTCLSLIIPSFNRATLISQTIDSALAQSRAFREIIVVDDGSSDNTLDVLSRYGDKIRVIPIRHAGVQAARNQGVAAATSTHIALCDSDDLLEPDFVETAARWLDQHPAYQALYTNFITFNSDGQSKDDKFSQAPPGWFAHATERDGYLCDIPDLYLRTVEFQPLFSSGVILQTAFYQQLGGYDAGFNGIGAEDWEFTLRVVATGKVALCPRPLVRIRKHEGNDSGDTIKTVRGTADILEYALRKHPTALQYRQSILLSIDSRRLGVFDEAFARGQFDTAAQMLSLLRTTPGGARFRLKALITRLPHFLRRPAWSLTQ